MHGQPAVHALPLTMHDAPSDRIAALFDTHHARVYRLARRLSRSADDALDLVQETFLRAARDPGAVPAGTTAEEAWLVRVLINLQRDVWRRADVRDRHVSDLPGPHHGTPDVERAAVAQMTVWRALNHLPPRRRAIVILHELEELDTGRVASLLGISRVTVRWHLARAHRELARLITGTKGAIHARR